MNSMLVKSLSKSIKNLSRHIRCKPKYLPFLALILVLLPVLSGCTSSEAGKKLQVRLGFFPNLTHAPALVGIEKGIFANQLKGMEFQAEPFQAGPAVMEALAVGEIDLAYVGPVPAITGYLRGVGAKIVAGANNGGAVLLARPDSGITKPGDLAGKKVAIPQYGNTQDISLRKILADAGLKDKARGGTVEIIQAAPADMVILFTLKQIDAALVPEPWGVLLEQKVGARLVLDWDQVWRGGNYPTTVLLVSQKFQEQHPELLRSFLKGHQEAIQFIQQEPEESMRIVNRQIKKLTKKELDAKVLVKAFSRNRVTSIVDKAVLKEFADLAAEAGYIPKDANLDGLLIP